MSWFEKLYKREPETVNLNERAERFQREVDEMLAEVTRMTLPLQKKSFQCCTNCFDLSSENLDDITNCIKNCQKNPEEFGNAVQSELNQLQLSLTNCHQKCMNMNKGDANVEMERCAVKCYDSNQNMIKTIWNNLQKNYQNFT
ncbi:YOU2-like zinc finger protein, putative [Theileria annulata]|uniref:YOU2-like zinc finger protein, putative n=1 Tax=Theileria annulata TaxID=5874 RepID=Q4UEW9_THEAN|nr:YOU2-like zinc finger protein, putative [Theileria annulata]CAI74370.1 YOU2-like zinc finger protein, putative [Theileria annulata]|eukprot:XP_952102.1 YOU2-like zinc finger protein, putative [Theileria annulata]